MDAADRSHRSNLDTSFGLVDTVAVEPLLSVGTMVKDLVIDMNHEKHGKMPL